MVALPKILVTHQAPRRWDNENGCILSQTPNSLRCEITDISHHVQMLLSMWTSSTSGNSLSPFIRDLISLLVWTDEVSESGQPPKSDSQFFDDEAHFESDDSDEAPLIQTWQKIKPVAVRARGTSPFEVTAAGRRNVKVDLSMNSDSDAGRRFSRFAFPRTRLLQLPTCFDGYSAQDYRRQRSSQLLRMRSR